MIGQTLSRYRITAALGSGGMGEVYRAIDTNLHRDVAIKVLPPEVAEDPERIGRFKREAHLLAALNHPNIAAIYGLEEADGKPFLALELVEGEDLKERLTRGAIPVDEALEIAEQIAEALEEAHNKGIVHRDLKPANVKLTPEGKVKVLDFGLAKAWAGDASGVSSAPSPLSQSPTLANTGTVAGVILGTAAYMSPEQARGRPVDKRADVPRTRLPDVGAARLDLQDVRAEREPVWSPDGRRLAFTTDQSGDQNMLVKDLSGSQPAAPLPGGVGANPGERDLPENWSDVGDTLLFMTLGARREVGAA